MCLAETIPVYYIPKCILPFGPIKKDTIPQQCTKYYTIVALMSESFENRHDFKDHTIPAKIHDDSCLDNSEFNNQYTVIKVRFTNLTAYEITRVFVA